VPHDAWEAARAEFNRGADPGASSTPEAPRRALGRRPRWGLPEVEWDRLSPVAGGLAEIAAAWWSWWALASTIDHHGLPQWVILIPFVAIFLQGVK